MKKRKIFASLACSSLLVLALASCNNDNGGNTRDRKSVGRERVC